MIKTSYVRRRPRSSAGKLPGVVYFDGPWLRKKVIIMPLADYRRMKNQIRKDSNLKKHIKRIVERGKIR